MKEGKESLASGAPAARPRIAIPYIAWEIQLTCNMGCEFCYSSSWNRYRRRVTRDRLSVERIQQGLETLQATGLGIRYINWSGGEPLRRHPDLPAILEASAAAGFENILSTNGMFSVFPAIGHPTNRALSDRRFRAYLEEQIGAHLRWLSVSWDSADRRTNNEVMRLTSKGKRGSPHHHDDIMSILGMYRELRPDFHLKINTLVSQKNHRAGVLEIGEHLRDLEAVWKLIQFNPRECPKDFRAEYWLDTADFQKLLDLARKRYEGRPGFEGLHIASRFYDGTGEPYCFLVLNTSGQVLLPKGEEHVVLAELYGADGKPLSPEDLRRTVLHRLGEEVGGTETYRARSKGGTLTPLEVFCGRNLDILEGSYALDPLELEPFRLYDS